MEKRWIVDGHCDSLLFFINDKALGTLNPHGHWDLSRAKEVGLRLQFLAAYIEEDYKPYLATHRGLQLIEGALRFVKVHSDRVFLIRSAQDLKALQNSPKIGLLLSVEGGEILGESLFMVDIIFELGVRALGLTWNQRNAIGDGVGEDTGSRLTKFGERVVDRMNELGMIVDVSHLNEQGFWHVLERSTQPVIASHSCAYKLCPHPRNLTDDQIRALAENGGVIGINFYPEFLTLTGTAGLDDVIDHICHIADVGGIDVVGFGSDFDGIDRTPAHLEHVGHFRNLIDRLAQRGFNDREIDKICAQNFLRVLENVLK